MNNISGIDDEVGVDAANNYKYEIDESIKDSSPFKDESVSRDISEDPKSANLFSISEELVADSSRPALSTPRDIRSNDR